MKIRIQLVPNQFLVEIRLFLFAATHFLEKAWFTSLKHVVEISHSVPWNFLTCNAFESPENKSDSVQETDIN